jgi:ribosomal protein S18 acetylase RimI-like enzyme
VAVRDERLIAYALWRDNLIDHRMIDPVVDRHGFGTDLLRRIQERLRAAYEELRLESFEANHAANASYRRNGWVEATR